MPSPLDPRARKFATRRWLLVGGAAIMLVLAVVDWAGRSRRRERSAVGDGLASSGPVAASGEAKAAVAGRAAVDAGSTRSAAGAAVAPTDMTADRSEGTSRPTAPAEALGARPSLQTEPATARPEWTAEDILAAMERSYAAMESYAAEGRFSRRWLDKNLVYAQAPFRLGFRRPGRLRFEWLGEDDPYRGSLWANEQGVFELSEKTGLRRLSGLAVALKDGAAEPARHVVALLWPAAAPGEKLIGQAVRLGDETIGDVACYHLRGITTPAGRPREIWVGVDDLLLRQVLTESATAYGVGAGATTRYGSGREAILETYTQVAAGVGWADAWFVPGGGRP